MAPKFLDFTTAPPSRLSENSNFQGTSSPWLTPPGPKQTRKMQPSEDAQPSTSVNTPTIDPRFLLNPKAAGGSSANTSQQGSSHQVDLQGQLHDGADARGMSQLLPSAQALEDRADIPARQNKRSNGEADDDREQKKSKFAGPCTNGSGIIGEEIKNERKKYGGNAIDLTGEDDDDVMITGGTPRPQRDSGEEEVCIGVLPCQGNADRVPAAASFMGKEFWPITKITLRRAGTARDNIIEMVDKNGKAFGRLSVVHGSAIATLMPGAHLSGFRVKAFLSQRRRSPDEVVGAPISQSMKVHVNLYCKRKSATQVGRFLSQKQLFLETPQQVDGGKEILNPQVPQTYRDKPIGTGPSRPAFGSSSIAHTQRTSEEMRRDMTTLFDALEKKQTLPEKDADPSIIATELLPHQKQGLQFLFEQENHEKTSQENGDDETLSLWKRVVKVNGKQVWSNVITGHELSERPEPVRGGILADMMGLGKTLSILALVAQTIGAARNFGSQPVPAGVQGVARNAQGTLIVCPKSVLSNWTDQIASHVLPNQLSYCVYHGATRTQNFDELGQYDIVLTTYGTVAAEFNDSLKKKKALASLNWFRIVLDEAHTIRTASTRSAKGAFALNAMCRWAVTGTPVQNRLDDLGALIRFLRIKPFDEPNNWAQYILAPFKNTNSDVVDHLQALVTSITLRRGKENIGLTDRFERTVRLEFSLDEKQLYGLFASRSNMQLKGMMRENNVLRGKSYAHVLKSLLRLRMICDHGKEMLSEEDAKDLEGMDASNAIDLGDEPESETGRNFISDRQAYELLKMQRDNDMDDCSKCSRSIVGKKLQNMGDSDSESSSDDDDEDDMLGYLSPCYHLYCPTCKDDLVKNTNPPELRVDGYYDCQVCGAYVRFDFFALSRRGLEDYEEDHRPGIKKTRRASWNNETYSGPHTKVLALLQELQASNQETDLLPPDEPPIRSVVFTEWTSYLDLLEFALERHGHAFVRLDGSMNVRQRAAVLTKFKSDPDVRVLLVSIRAGGQGLNFTAANKVYMMEPQFNPGVEHQAIDRVHRLGQERAVQITRFIMKDSVEEALLKLQDKKLKLARLSMDKKSKTKEEDRQQRLHEIKDLFK